MGYGTLRAFSRLSAALFVGLDAIVLVISRDNPIIALGVMVGLITLGLGPLVYTLVVLERYKSVFDYEPTTLWGKPTNGKSARSTLMAINAIALWSLLAGGILLLSRIAIDW